MMPDAHGQDVLARCGFEALDGHPRDPVFQERMGFFVLGHEPHGAVDTQPVNSLMPMFQQGQGVI